MAAAVAAAGGLGTLGLAPPADLRDAIRLVRDAAMDRSVAVNLLMPFVRRSHVQACGELGIDVAVMAFGMDPVHANTFHTGTWRPALKRLGWPKHRTPGGNK